MAIAPTHAGRWTFSLLSALMLAPLAAPAGDAALWKAGLDRAVAVLHDTMDADKYNAALKALSKEIEESLKAEIAKKPHDEAAVATDAYWLATIYLRMQLKREAAVLLLKALEIRSRKFGEDSLEAAEVMEQVAWIADEDKVEAVMRRVLQIREKVHGPVHREVADTVRSIGMNDLTSGRLKHAEVQFRRAVAIMEQLSGPDHADVVDALTDLGWLFVRGGRYDEAIAVYKRALAIREKAGGADSPSFAEGLEKLGYAYEDAKRYEEAEAQYLRALAIREKLDGRNHHRTLFPVGRLADIYTLTKQRSKLREMRQRLEEAYEKGR